MSVFTVYCHGTGSHRDDSDKEIVSYMGRGAKGQEYRDYLILDGPGKKGSTTARRNPMAGTFDWTDRNKGAKPNGRGALEMGGGTKATSWSGNVDGAGLEDNVRHAVVTIANLNPLPTTINMIGWSRGAVTTLYLANALFDPTSVEGLFRSVNVNIFAVDPVAGQEAGVGKNAEFRRLIPPTVKNYVGILAKGENRSTFKPQDLSRVQIVDSGSSNVLFLPFPGVHGTVAKAEPTPQGRTISGIVWTLAHQFLDHFGTVQTRKPMMLSRQGILESYSTIVLDRGKGFSKMKQKGLKNWIIGKGYSDRGFTKQLDSYTKNSDYFVNEHHRAIFKRLCPATYRWLFTQKDSVNNPCLTSRVIARSHPIAQEILRNGPNSDLIASLEAIGVEADPRGFRLPAPGSGQGSRVHFASTQAEGDLHSMGLI